MVNEAIAQSVTEYLHSSGVPLVGIAAVQQRPSMPDDFSPQRTLKTAQTVVCYGVPIPKGVVYAEDSIPWNCTGATAMCSTGPWMATPTNCALCWRNPGIWPVRFMVAFHGRCQADISGVFCRWCNGRNRRVWAHSPRVAYWPTPGTAPGFCLED